MFILDFDELEERYSLDGVYEEISSFDKLTEMLFKKTKEETFQTKMTKYLTPAI